MASSSVKPLSSGADTPGANSGSITSNEKLTWNPCVLKLTNWNASSKHLLIHVD